MKLAMKSIALLGLAATIVPCLLLFAGRGDLNMVQWLALIGTAIWFVAAPLWMGRGLPVDANQVEI